MVEIGNKWPLMVVPLPRENALRKEATAHLPSQDQRDSVISDKRIESESDTFLEKGTLIDLYI
jgi:hypothetical protein